MTYGTEFDTLLPSFAKRRRTQLEPDTSDLLTKRSTRGHDNGDQYIQYLNCLFPTLHEHDLCNTGRSADNDSICLRNGSPYISTLRQLFENDFSRRHLGNLQQTDFLEPKRLAPPCQIPLTGNEMTQMCASQQDYRVMKCS
jgi:hypothetical protein